MESTPDSLPNIPGFNLKAFLNFTEDVSRTQETFRIMESLKSAPQAPSMSAWTYKTVSASKEFQEIFEQRYAPVFPTTKELLAYPEASLGRMLGEHLDRHNISADFQGLDTKIYYKNTDNILGFFGMRALVHHDTLHVLLGRGISDIDELALSAFQLGQFYSPYHTNIATSILLHNTFYSPDRLPETLDDFTKYYALGKSTPLVFATRFEELWDQPLKDIQKKLGLL